MADIGLMSARYTQHKTREDNVEKKTALFAWNESTGRMNAPMTDHVATVVNQMFTIEVLCSMRFGNVHNETAHLAEKLVQDYEEDTTDTKTEVENALISSGEMVLMQTAKANIRNRRKGTQENGRILFDSGSQWTYITESLAKKWIWHWVKWMKLRILPLDQKSEKVGKRHPPL